MDVGSVLIYVATGVAAAIGVGVLVVAVTPWRLRWEKSKVPAKNRWSQAQTVWLIVCGVVVAGGAGLVAANAPATTSRPQISPAPSPAMVQFTSPHDVQGQSLPTVGCVMNVTGTGSIPAGDVLVLGSVVRGNPNQVPLQAVQWSGTASWSVTLHFGQASDANHIFDIRAVVMPESWNDYLLSEAHYYQPNSGETWWASGEPPAPAEVAASVAVVRLPVARNKCA